MLAVSISALFTGGSIGVVMAAAPTYSPGLGDNLNTLHWLINIGHRPTTGYVVNTTYPQALQMFQQMYYATNGTHQVGYTIGQDVGRFGNSPDLPEDYDPPLGDGTPGSGFENYRQFSQDAYQYNADVGLFLDTSIIGPDNVNITPSNQRSLDASGNWKSGWCYGGLCWMKLSLHNRIAAGDQWSMLDGFVNDYGMTHSVYEDAFIFNNIRNQSTALGGAITTDAQENTAAVQEMDYLWNTYAVSNFTEDDRTNYQGHAWGFAGPGNSSDDQHLNFWGKSVIYMFRTLNDLGRDLAWGSEWGPRTAVKFFAHNYTSQPYAYPMSDLRAWFFKHTVQYLYMQKFTPLSYTNNASINQVQFSDNLLSTYSKTSGNYTLTQGTLTLADEGDRFVPQVGAGAKVIAFSESGSNKAWTLPSTWSGVTEADRYKLTMAAGPAYVDTLAVTSNQVNLNMTADTAYVLVPRNTAAMPTTAMFNQLNHGNALTAYSGITWNVAGNPTMRIQGPNATGGFGSDSVYLDSTLTSKSAQIILPVSGVLHSVRIGNKGGTGTVTLDSSNGGNSDAVMSLPAAGQTGLIETNWRNAESGNVTITVSNGTSVKNVLFDNLVFTAPSTATPPNTVDSDDAAVTYTGTTQTFSDTADIGGSHTTLKSNGATAVIAFTGTSAKVIGWKANNFGHVKVYVDNVYQQTVDLYSATTIRQYQIYDTGLLSPGSHTVKLEAIWTKNASSSNYYVAFDALTMGTGAITTVDNDDAAATYTGTTQTFNNAADIGGSHIVLKSNGATATIAFTGSNAKVVGLKANNFGNVKVYVDNVYKQTVDLYSATTAYQQQIYDTGVLSLGSHIVKLEAIWTKNAASSNYYVAFDALTVTN